MKLRADKCHVEMKPDFLFDKHNKFKSIYTPWVYICIYLSDVKTIKYYPNNFFKTDTNLICELLDTDSSTISRTKDQLAEYGLIDKKGHLVKVNHNISSSLFEEVEGFQNYIKVNNNFLFDFLPRLKNALPYTSKKEKTLVKVLQVYHYLIAKNRHHIINAPIVESKETSESISAFLHHDENYVKKYLRILETIGQIKIDDDGRIYTLYNYGTREPFKKNYAIQNSQMNNRIIQITRNDSEAEVSTNEFEPMQKTECVLEKEEAKKNLIVNEDNQIISGTLTDKEKIERILKITDGSPDKTKKLFEAFNVSEASIREYIENDNQKQISNDDITIINDDEVSVDFSKDIELDDNEIPQNNFAADGPNSLDNEKDSPYNEFGYVYITEDVDMNKLEKDFEIIERLTRVCTNKDIIDKVLKAKNISNETVDEYFWRLDHCYEIEEKAEVPA